MGGSSSRGGTPPVVSNANININITKNGKEAVDQALERADDPKWKNQMDKAQNVSNDAHHDCGPGNRGSKDSDTVYNLERYVNNNNNNGITNLLEKHAIDLYDSVNYNNGKCWNYWKSVAQETEKIKGEKTNNLNAEHTNKVNSYNETIKQLNELQNEREKALVIKKQTLSDIQAELERVKAELITEKGYLSKITGVKTNATSNVQVLTQYKDSLTENIKTNEDFNKYLNDRITITRDIGVDNYEELYQAVILQNEILENTKNELDSNIVSSDRKSSLISNKKDFVYSIYVKLRIGYYLLLLLFLIFLIFLQKGWSVYFKILLFFIAAIYPFTIIYIEDFMYNIARFMLSIISGSVYTYHNLQ